MVETISPVVHGDRRTRYVSTVALHTIAAGVAAALLGALLGTVGLLLGAPWGTTSALVVAAAAGLYAAREAFRLPIPVPDRHKQVPEWWRTFFSPHVAALLYGAGLGVGFLTFLSFGTYTAVAVTALASGSPLLGALLCLPFGVARGLSVLIGSGPKRTPNEAIARLEDLSTTSAPRLANAAVLSLVAVAALMSL